MFSGIVEELGTVAADQNGDRGRLTIAASRAVQGAATGDSIAVNGVCVTVSRLTGAGFSADVMPETLQRTTLGTFRPGDPVNLERSLGLGDRIGGHMVTGHVDAVGTVAALRNDGNARWVTIDAPQTLMPMIASKGSIAVDGISLTVVDVFDSAFTVSLIPFTLENTTAGGWGIGSIVNVEVDLLARYVHRVLTEREPRAPEARPSRSPRWSPRARVSGSDAELRPRPRAARSGASGSRSDRIVGDNQR